MPLTWPLLFVTLLVGLAVVGVLLPVLSRRRRYAVTLVVVLVAIATLGPVVLHGQELAARPEWAGVWLGFFGLLLMVAVVLGAARAPAGSQVFGDVRHDLNLVALGLRALFLLGILLLGVTVLATYAW